MTWTRIAAVEVGNHPLTDGGGSGFTASVVPILFVGALVFAFFKFVAPLLRSSSHDDAKQKPTSAPLAEVDDDTDDPSALTEEDIESIAVLKNYFERELGSK